MRIESVSLPVRFSGEMTPQQLEKIRPLVDQVPGFRETYAKYLSPETSAYMSATNQPLGWIEMFRLGFESLLDYRRAKKVIDSVKKEHPDKPAVFLQWVRFEEKQNDTLEIKTNLCKGNQCPVTRDGKPATGRATLGHDMISWRIYD